MEKELPAISDPTDRCLICQNLDPDSSPKVFRFKKWVVDSPDSDCIYCRLLLESLKKLKPKLLKDDRLLQDLETRLLIAERGRVLVLKLQDGWSTAIAEVQIYSTKAVYPEIRNIAKCGNISAEPGDESMWQFLKQSLDVCLNNHSKCRAQQESQWYPSRLLQLTDNKTVRLVETASHPPYTAYTALSHCWGKEPCLRTLAGNISRFRDHIPFDDLPRTFQDAIYTTQRMGLQYLWIDSLCILQDNRSDWAIHSSKMDKIFSNALFTIAAVSSPNGTVPFLGSSAPNRRGKYQSVDVTNPFDLTQPLKARKQFAALLPLFVEGPLEDRAWTWQERHLSIRVMHFEAREARWECQEAQGCECMGTLEPRSYKSHRHVDPEHLHEQWRDLVVTFSKRLLTYSTDRLPALAGAASRFLEVAKTEYLAGLWRDQFPYALAWYARLPGDCPTVKSPMWYALDNKVPSWSWASVQNEAWWTWSVLFSKCGRKEYGDVKVKTEAELVGSDCRPSTENPFGEVRDGSWIELKGKVVEAVMEVDRYGCACVRREGFGAQLVYADCDIVSEELQGSSGAETMKKPGSPGNEDEAIPILRRATREDYHQRSDNHAQGQVLCLLLASIEVKGKRHVCVLVLGRSVDDATTYCRFGIGSGNYSERSIYSMRKDWDRWKGWDELEEWDDWERWFEGGRTRTLRIV